MHFLGLISWMAGLFYLPRIFVYHVESTSEDVKKTLDIMGYKLYTIIMQPAMFITLIFGSLLAILPHNISAGWLHAKLSCILGLVVFQYYLNRCRINLALRKSNKSSRHFRLTNEIPTLALIIILICAIFKPF